MKIKKVDDKPMVLHTQKEPKLHIRKNKNKTVGYTLRTGRKSPFGGVKEKMEQSNESIKVRRQRLHAMEIAVARVATDNIEGGEELRESTEVMAVMATPVVGIASKGAYLYRKKQTEKKKSQDKNDTKRRDGKTEYSGNDYEHKKSGIKAKEKGDNINRKKSAKNESGSRKGTGANGAVKGKMIETFLANFRIREENQQSFLQNLKNTAKAAAEMAVKKMIALMAPYVLGTFGVIALCGVVVVTILGVIYNSPLAIFFPMPETGYENPRTVLSEYYKEFNQTIIAKEEAGNTLTYKNTENGVAVSNYNDTLMVYMILYGDGQAGYIMDDTGRANLKKVFDEMNYISDESTTTTMQVGDSLGDVVATGYCACSICCGQWAGGNTASGTKPKANHTLAVDAYNPIVPMGTKVLIGNTVYTVEDTGNLNANGTDFDIFFASHDAALQWGKQTVEAFIAEGNSNEVEVTTNGTTVFNLTYEDYIALGTLNEEQITLLTELMSDEMWKQYYSSGIGQAVAEMAMTKIGCHYSQDRRMEEGYYDCSSLVYRLYKEAGIELPLIASEQGKYCYENAMIINKEELQPGDLIFYSYEINGQFRNISHVAIYVGDGRMVHAANTDRGVVMDDLKTGSVVFYARPYN